MQRFILLGLFMLSAMATPLHAQDAAPDRYGDKARGRLNTALHERTPLAGSNPAWIACHRTLALSRTQLSLAIVGRVPDAAAL